MNALLLLAAGLIGCFLYRLGRKEGEAGRVLPLVRRRSVSKRGRAEKLLDDIERYDGTPKGGRK